MAHSKKSSLLLIILLSFVLITLVTNVNAEQQEPEYEVGFDAGTELIWEVTQLDAYTFQLIFGFEPNFEIGDQIRIVISDVKEFTITYVVDYVFWDYKIDWAEPGEEFSLIMYKDPSTYDDYLYSLSPVQDYLSELGTYLPSEYTILGTTIIKQDISDEGKQYRWEKEYDIRGIPVVETYYDEFDTILVRVEGTFRIISFGAFFIGFMIAGMLGLMAIVFLKRKLNVRI